MSIQTASRKIGLALIGLIGLAALFSTYGINTIRFGGEMHRVNQQLNDFNADILPPPEYLVEAYLVANLVARSPGQVDTYAGKLASLRGEWRKRADHWAESDLDADLKAGLAATVAQDGAAFWQVVDQRLLPAARSDNAPAMAAALVDLDSIYERHRARIDTLVADGAQLQGELADNGAGTLLAISIGLMLAALLVFGGILTALRLLRQRVIGPLTTISDTMARMAGGDLDAGQRTDHSADEIGTMTRAIEVFRQSAIDRKLADAERERVVAVLGERLKGMAQGDLNQPIAEFFAPEYKNIRMDFNGAQAALREVIHSVVHSAQAIDHSASDVNEAAGDLSERTARQAAILEETAAALQRTNQGIQVSAELAQNTNAEVARARQNVTQNRAIVATAVEAMEQIQASFAEVENITNIIQQIAFQTNILALNAGVEATRAGEAGKGFGVVAIEVRALAQRSSEAVTSIQQLMAKSREKIEHGSQQVTASGHALREMIDMIDRVSERVEQLAASSIVQAQNLNEVDASLSDLERDTQQNAAMAEQSSAASGLLNHEVRQLNQRTAMFTQAEQGRAGSALVDLRMVG